MKNLSEKQTIVSVLLQSFESLTKCNLCENPENVNVYSCGHLYCKLCSEQIKKPSSFTCKICKQTTVYRYDTKENKILALINKLTKIDVNNLTDVICDQLSGIFHNQQIDFDNVKVRKVIKPHKTEKSEQKSKTIRTEERANLDINENNLINDKSSEQKQKVDKIRRSGNLRERKQNASAVQKSESLDELRINPISDTNVSGVESSVSADSSNQLDSVKKERNILNRSQRRKSKISDFPGSKPVSNALETVEDTTKEEKVPSDGKLDSNDLKNNPDPKLSNTSNTMRTRSRTEAGNDKRVKVSKRLSATVSNNETLLNLRKTFNVPAVKPLLVEKGKKKSASTTFANKSFESNSSHENSSNSIENIQQSKEDVQSKSSLEEIKDASAGENNENSDSFDGELDKDTPDKMEIEENITTKDEPSDEAIDKCNNGNDDDTEQYCSVATQTTSDLHKALLLLEFPELLTNHSTNSVKEYKTPIDRKINYATTPIDSGNGKSIILSSVTSSEKKNFDEEEFMNKSVIDHFSLFGQTLDNDAADKTLCDSDQKTSNDIPSLNTPNRNSRKRSYKFDGPPHKNCTVKISRQSYADGEIVEDGISVLDRKADVNNILSVLPDKTVTPSKRSYEEDDIACSIDMVAKTPTQYNEVIVNDGTMDKLINRSLNLDSYNSEDKTVLNESTNSQNDPETLTVPVKISTEKRNRKALLDGRSGNKTNDSPRSNAGNNSNKEETASIASSVKSFSGNNFCFVTSGLNQSEVKLVQIISEKMSVKYSNKLTDQTTHLIVKADENNRVPRTLKYFQALVKRINIVTLKWVESCYGKSKFFKEEDFMPLDFSGECGPFRSFLASRGLGDSLDWLKNYCIYYTEPYPAACPLPQLQEMVKDVGAVSIEEMNDFLKYPDHHNIILIADEVEENTALSYKIYGWLKKYQAVTVMFSWFLEVIGRYRLVPFLCYQTIPVAASSLEQLKYPSEMLENEEFSDADD